jgi:2-oxoisovalerate dehydrogenase E2 component (dihydrolipoyl transacylase)
MRTYFHTFQSQDGDTVKAFDKICEVQSDKATVEITSRFDGKIVHLHHTVGSIVKVGSALLDIATTSVVAATTATESKTTLHNAHAQSIDVNAVLSTDKVLTTPSVRKIAKENNVNLAIVPGTGPKGRILKEDILKFIKNRINVEAPVGNFLRPQETTEAPAAATLPITTVASVPIAVAAEDVRVPIRGVQRLMVKSMSAANQVKHLTLGEEVSFDKMRVLRQQLKGPLGKQGIKLSYMPLIIKATSLALAEYPMLNATVNAEVTEMIHHANHNIGVAMDTPKGLIVPVIKSVQNKSIADIARELNSLQEIAAKGAITEAHLSGGTFSISNIGASSMIAFLFSMFHKCNVDGGGVLCC